ncbi:phosphatidate cytidylyltransferase [Coprothermobacteraceae bacterium]|nr:phosphatidate cytidylyltransferase [Coprothermobacteraceae bacterium]
MKFKLFDRELVVRTLLAAIIVSVVMAASLNVLAFAVFTNLVGLVSSIELSRMYKQPLVALVPIWLLVYCTAVFGGLELAIALGFLLFVVTSLTADVQSQESRLMLVAKAFAIYIGLSSAALFLLYKALGSAWALLSFWWVLWAFDAVAYLWGRYLGVEKLAPHLSPGKNIEGFVAGYITGLLASGVLAVLLHNPSLLAYGVIVPISGISGDLLESLAKRIVNVKDSSNLIPYHGGIWDRFDSALMASIALLVAMRWL